MKKRKVKVVERKKERDGHMIKVNQLVGGLMIIGWEVVSKFRPDFLFVRALGQPKLLKFVRILLPTSTWTKICPNFASILRKTAQK
jgi:hypothetical protein